jgi:hypothetical protein
MSDATDSNKTIIQYLLGALPGAETERLDELSFTSEEFAETLAATEKDLIDAYVQGELSGETLKRFEGRCLASPLLREKVEFAESLQIFGAREAARLAADETKAGWFAALSAYLTPRPILQWALVLVALALIVTASWLIVDNVRLRRQTTEAQTRRELQAQREQELLKQIEAQRSANSERDAELTRLREERSRLEQELEESRTKSSASDRSVLSFVLTPPLRGAGQITTQKVKPEIKQISARLELEAANYSAYRVELVNAAGNQVLWRSGKLKPQVSGEHKAIAVSFAAGLLQSQNYVLRVSGLNARGTFEIVGDYAFRVMR